MLILAYTSYFEELLSPLYASYYAQTYYGMVLYIIFAVILCGILAAAAYIFSLSSLQDSEKRSEYECGFEPFDSATRLPFDVHFYMVGILFLIFDVEIALLFPWVLGLRAIGWFGFYVMLGFILLLGIGFLYEWNRGALVWPHPRGDISTNKHFMVSPSRKSQERGVRASISLSMVTLADLAESWLARTVELDGATTLSAVYAHLLALVPELYLLGAICFTLLWVAVKLGERGHQKKALAGWLLFRLRNALFVTALLYVGQLSLDYAPSLFNDYFIVNKYVTTMKLLTVLSALFISMFSHSYFLWHTTRHRLEYWFVFSLAVLLMLLLVSSGHLISAFLALVGFSLNIYVLIFFSAPSAVVREAGIKYFYLSAFSSGLFIYGTFLVFLVTGTGHFYELSVILTHAIELQTAGLGLLQLAIVFILTGLFFKLSAFPGHLWAADVYEGSDDHVMAFFMLPAKVAVLAFVLNLLATAFAPLASLWQPIIAMSAAGSLIWGCLAALTETKIKRFLAYASINQIGFLLLGVATNTHEGYRTTILYLFLYVLMNIVFLGIFLTAFKGGRTRLRYLSDFRGFRTERWTQAWSLTVALLSMAGIPPLAGFFGKYFLLLHAQEQGFYGLVIIGLVTSLISTYYYLRIIKIIWFEDKTNMDAVECPHGPHANTLLFVVESFLWSFIVLSGPLMAMLDSAALDLSIVAPQLLGPLL